MPRCIYSLNEFEAADGEHILQNFLGARWTSNAIVSNDLQAEFGKTIDSALEEGLRPIRNLFGTRGGRGEAGPLLRNLRASTGELLDLEPGLVPRLRQPIVTSTELPNGRRHVTFQLGIQSHLRWALSMLRSQVPALSADEATLRSLGRSVDGYIQGTVQLDLRIGGADYFRGMLKSCFNLLGVNYPQVVCDPCFNAARNFILSGDGTSRQFVRWCADVERLAVPRLGPIDQAIFLVSRGQSVEGVVQYFGDIVHSFQLSDKYDGVPVHCGYIADPFREANPAETREPDFPDESVPMFAVQAPVNSPAVQAAFHARLTRILKVFYDRAHHRIVDQTLNEVLTPHLGQPFTEELVGQLAQRLAERIARRGGPG